MKLGDLDIKTAERSLKTRFRERAETLLGIVLVTLVGVGTIALSPLVAKGLESMPWLIYMYNGGAPFEPKQREAPDPLPFETAGLTTEELVGLGIPVAAGPTFLEVESESVFPPGHVLTDAANEKLILSARRAVWAWEAGSPGLGVDILIVELPTKAWATSPATIWAFEPPTHGQYPEDATQAHETGQTEEGPYGISKVQFVHGRLWVVVQVGTGPAYASAVAAGTAHALDTDDLSRQAALSARANLPTLDDLQGWDTLPTDDLRIANAASLGLAATLTVLARAIGTGLLDRGSREATASFIRRRVSPKPTDALLTPKVQRQRRQARIRTLALALGSGASLVLLYFVTADMGLVEMFLLVAGVILALVLAATFLRRRSSTEDLGRRWLVAEGVGTAMSAIVVGAGIFCVGTGGIGFTMGGAATLRTVSLVMVVLGLAVVGFASWPTQMFRRLAMPAIKQALGRDERAPVLFLRSFQDDDLRVRIHSGSRVSPAERLALLNDSTFEDLIAWKASRVGPVIAIGQPGTQLQPLGAVRDYFSDDEWQTAVLKRINLAAAVIFIVGRSPGAQWELAQLRERGALGKTLFIFPPVERDEHEKRCFVLGAGLGLDIGQLIGDVAWGVLPLIALRIGPSGEVIRYLADGRDDFAYGLAVEQGLAGIGNVRTVVNAPADACDVNASVDAQAKTLLVKYDPTRKSASRSDPFRRALGFFLDRV